MRGLQFLDGVNQTLLREMAEQIKKDFGWYGLKFVLTDTNENIYETIFGKVMGHVKELVKKDNAKFFQLMYRIDIDEQKITNAVRMAVDRSFEEVVTDLILNRELEKVMLRKKYSKGRNLNESNEDGER